MSFSDTGAQTVGAMKWNCNTTLQVQKAADYCKNSNWFNRTVTSRILHWPLKALAAAVDLIVNTVVFLPMKVVCTAGHLAFGAPGSGIQAGKELGVHTWLIGKDVLKVVWTSVIQFFSGFIANTDPIHSNGDGRAHQAYYNDMFLPPSHINLDRDSNEETDEVTNIFLDPVASEEAALRDLSASFGRVRRRSLPAAAAVPVPAAPDPVPAALDRRRASLSPIHTAPHILAATQAMALAAGITNPTSPNTLRRIYGVQLV